VLKLAVVSPNPDTLDAMVDGLSGIAALDGVLQLPKYPALDQIEQLAELAAGSVLLLDFRDFPLALKIAASFDSSSHDIKSIAVFPAAPSREHLVELMQVGIREVLAAPFGRTDICGAVMRATGKSSRNAEGVMLGEVHAFLPAKPGVGATTVCLSVAAAAARLANRRTLLLDFDLKLGVTSFLLKLDGTHSVSDALAESTRLDDDLWDKLVGRRDALEILGSAPSQSERTFAASDYAAVLIHAQRIYATTCVDLPGNMDEYEVETLRRAAHIYLVCTGEMTALHVAKRKIAQLNELRVLTPLSVVLNFAGRRGSLSASDIQQVIQAPIHYSLPYDDSTVPAAVKAGKPITGRSALAQKLEQIAAKISVAPNTGGRPQRSNRFIEFFSVSSARTRLW
jgi:Flp pilus assembly CpaE family ATPase